MSYEDITTLYGLSNHAKLNESSKRYVFMSGFITNLDVEYLCKHEIGQAYVLAHNLSYPAVTLTHS